MTGARNQIQRTKLTIYGVLNVILQTSTSVKQTLTCAVLMPFVTTPMDPSIAHVDLDTEEMEKNVQVIFILVSGIKRFVFVSVFVCLIYSRLFP